MAAEHRLALVVIEPEVGSILPILGPLFATLLLRAGAASAVELRVDRVQVWALRVVGHAPHVPGRPAGALARVRHLEPGGDRGGRDRRILHRPVPGVASTWSALQGLDRGFNQVADRLQVLLSVPASRLIGMLLHELVHRVGRLVDAAIADAFMDALPAGKRHRGQAGAYRERRLTEADRRLVEVVAKLPHRGLIPCAWLCHL